MTQSQTHWPRPVLLPFALGLLLRLIQVQSPIVGVHSWRQADTAAMARHFALENTPIWLPQIDWGGFSPGYVECEFPLFPYLLGQIYKLFGIHEWLGRSLSALLSALTILIVIRIGEQLLDPVSGWWGGLFFAVLPLSIYYGRTLQAEALLMFLAALSLERHLAWKQQQNPWALSISWLTFCLACLIKVLPMVWLGLPLLALQLHPQPLGAGLSINQLNRNLRKLGRSPGPWIYLGATLLFGVLWYFHAYQLGQNSGLSFGFWGPSSDRSSLRLILDLQLWLDLLLRISVRGLAVIGLPLLLLGLWKSRQQAGGQILGAGLVGLLICTAFALRASSIHEYYQLPLLLFFCPLMGKGWAVLTSLASQKGKNAWLNSSLSLLMIISLMIINIDYWAVERRQAEIWMPLAQSIRQEVPAKSRIVSVTNGDPTLLNLARRQGWLASAEEVNPTQLQAWANQGASHMAGSLNWKETYALLPNSRSKHALIELLCQGPVTSSCPQPPHRTYLVPLNLLIP